MVSCVYSAKNQPQEAITLVWIVKFYFVVTLFVTDTMHFPHHHLVKACCMDFFFFCTKMSQIIRLIFWRKRKLIPNVIFYFRHPEAVAVMVFWVIYKTKKIVHCNNIPFSAIFFLISSSSPNTLNFLFSFPAMPNLVLNAAKLWRNAMDVIRFNVPNVPMNAVGCVYKDGASILCAIDSLKLETKISDSYTFIYVTKIIPIVEQWKTKSSKMKLIGEFFYMYIC